MDRFSIERSAGLWKCDGNKHLGAREGPDDCGPNAAAHKPSLYIHVVTAVA